MNMLSTNSNNKFVVEDIDIPENQMQELKSKLKRGVKKGLTIRKYCSGVCTLCASIPSKKVSYDVGDSKLIDFYCSECFEKNKAQLHLRLENMNFT